MRTSAVAATVRFRALVTGVLAFLAVLNLWVPVRGTVLALRTMPLPWGGTGLLAIRTPPGAPLAVQYLFVLAIQVYGFFVARAIWKRDRTGAVLVAIGAVGDPGRIRARVPRRLREGPGAVRGRLPARDQRALRGFLPLAGVLGARRAGRPPPRGSSRPPSSTLRSGRRSSRRTDVFSGSTAPSATSSARPPRRSARRRLYDIFHDDDEGSIEISGGCSRARAEPTSLERRLVRKEGDPVLGAPRRVGRPR